MINKIMSLVVLGVFVCNVVFAMCGMCGSDDNKAAANPVNASAPIKVNNTVCPVTGEKVDMNNPVTVEHDGKIYNLCCPMCSAEFKKDPAKYIAKINAKK